MIASIRFMGSPPLKQNANHGGGSAEARPGPAAGRLMRDRWAAPAQSRGAWARAQARPETESPRAPRAAERSERGVRTRRASPAGARGGEPLAGLAAATHPDPEAWPEGENPRGDRLPAVAVRPRRWQVVDGEPERREEAGEPHEIRDE